MPVSLTILGNLLPVAGVLFLGWDIYTLLVYYWCETLIVGFWTALSIALQGREVGGGSENTIEGRRTGSSKAAILLALHAGFFIAVHLLLMSTLYGQDWPGHLDSPLVFVETFIVGQGLWPMLAVTFLQRAATFWERRGGESRAPAVVELYVRIAVIQFVVILGAWGVMLLDNGLIGLALLVAMKTMLDLYWPKVFAWIVNSGVQPRNS